MRVQNPGILKFQKQKLESSKQVKKVLDVKNNVSSGVLSFMAIPRKAFESQLVIPVLPDKFKHQPVASINIKPKPVTKRYTEPPVIKYKVYPQDPLVSKPEMYKLPGAVGSGPQNMRVKTVDESKIVLPDKQGNYTAEIDTPQFDRVNSYLFSNQTLQMFEKALGRNIPWAFDSSQIKVYPRAGEMMNAYYNRWGQEIKLFHFKHRFKPEETCYTSKMADVITHETGHAVLDGLRPAYIGWGTQGGAIHEGFGDSAAMLVAMMNENILDKVIEKTGGDLKKENLIASLAEQFGEAVYGNRLYLRNAINDLKMSDFTSGKVSKEVHSFGRLIAATFYDIIVDMADQYSKTMPLKEALIKTREDASRLLARAVGDYSPTVNVYFADIAKAFLKADKVDFDGNFHDLLKNVFYKRELLNDANIKGWDNELKNLPELTIPESDLESKQTIERFVSKSKKILKVPSDNSYKLESAYKNEFGETFLQMKAPRELEMPITDPSNGMPFGIIVYDSLSLGFDKDNKLFYMSVKNLKRRGMDLAIADVKETLEKAKSDYIKGSSEQPVVYRKDNDSNILIKTPKLEDPVGV